jgi:hypothetical protein
MSPSFTSVRGRVVPIVFATLLLLPLAPRCAGTTPAQARGIDALSCSGGLELMLRPGPVPPAGAIWNKPPARDIPPGPVIERFPLYPGAVASRVALPPLPVIGALPPDYRKVARADFQVSAPYQMLSAWYRRNLAGCRFYAVEFVPLQRHGGAPYAGLGFDSPAGPSELTLIFRPLSTNLTGVLYFAQTLDLPPRPAASFLHGPFTRVRVDFRQSGGPTSGEYEDRFTIVWPATIVRLVKLINRPTRIWVVLPGGVGTPFFVQTATLSFQRRDGGVRKVFVGGAFDQLIVGHTRPLVDRHVRVLRLAARITHRRCPSAGVCR